VKTKPLLVLPGADFCQTPRPGTFIVANVVADSERCCRSKRIDIRFVPLIVGIEPVNVAVRSLASGPDTHALSFARSGGACACATAGAASARSAMVSATRRMGLIEHPKGPAVAPGCQVTW
jgi:hypothetical protein